MRGNWRIGTHPWGDGLNSTIKKIRSLLVVTEYPEKEYLILPVLVSWRQLYINNVKINVIPTFTHCGNCHRGVRLLVVRPHRSENSTGSFRIHGCPLSSYTYHYFLSSNQGFGLPVCHGRIPNTTWHPFCHKSWYRNCFWQYPGHCRTGIPLIPKYLDPQEGRTY